MKTTITFLLCFALLGFAASTQWVGADSFQDEKKAQGDHEAIEKQMKSLKSATRRLKRAFRKETVKAADVLKDVQACNKALLVSKDLFPGNLQGEKNAKKRAEYSSMMIDCLIEGLKCEKAVLANDMKKAAEALKGMTKIQKAGHDKFRE